MTELQFDADGGHESHHPFKYQCVHWIGRHLHPGFRGMTEPEHSPKIRHLQCVSVSQHAVEGHLVKDSQGDMWHIPRHERIVIQSIDDVSHVTKAGSSIQIRWVNILCRIVSKTSVRV